MLDQARSAALAILERDPELRDHPFLADLLDQQRQRLSASVRLN